MYNRAGSLTVVTLLSLASGVTVAGTPPDAALRQDPAFTIVEEIRYSSEAGVKGFGDLFIPRNVERPRTVLLIHGGSWRSMVRHRMQHVAAFLAREGYAVFNTSYRLLPEAPYPACETDCIAAARFVLDGDHPQLAKLNRERIVVAGFSAGGHLAMMTGLKLPREKVAGIIDGCGPTELHAPEVAELMKRSAMFRELADKTQAFRNASPTLVAQARNEPLPPLLVLHCQQDAVVSVEQAYRIINVWKAAHADCQAFLYAGNRKSGHDVWRNGKPELHTKLERQIITFLATFLSRDGSPSGIRARK